MEVPCKPGQEQPRAGREKQPASASFIKIPRAASNRKFTRAAALSLRAQGQQNKDSTGKPVCFPSPPPRVPAAGPFWLPGFPCCVGHRGSPRRWPGPGSQPCFPFRKRKQRSSGKVYFKRRLFGRHRNSAEGRGLILSCPVPLQQGVPKPGSGIIDSSPTTTYWEVSRSKNSSRSVLTKHPCRDGGGQGWGQAGAQQWGHKLNSRGGVWREL